jgi:hypothetical protein
MNPRLLTNRESRYMTALTAMMVLMSPSPLLKPLVRIVFFHGNPALAVRSRGISAHRR